MKIAKPIIDFLSVVSMPMLSIADVALETSEFLVPKRGRFGGTGGAGFGGGGKGRSIVLVSTTGGADETTVTPGRALSRSLSPPGCRAC